MTKSLMHMISCDNKEFSDESKAQPSKHFSTKTLEFINTHCKYACLGETPLRLRKRCTSRCGLIQSLQKADVTKDRLAKVESICDAGSDNR